MRSITPGFFGIGLELSCRRWGGQRHLTGLQCQACCFSLTQVQLHVHVCVARIALPSRQGSAVIEVVWLVLSWIYSQARKEAQVVSLSYAVDFFAYTNTPQQTVCIPHATARDLTISRLAGRIINVGSIILNELSSS